MIKDKLKVIFVGMPDMAIVCLANLLEKGFDIVGVVPPKKTHETYSYFKTFVQSKNLNFIEYENSCNDNDCIEQIKKLNADIGVVCSYNYLLSEEFLKTTKMGYINSHPSKLPHYRGAAPYFHIINNGAKNSAITLHFMDKTFDTGDIIYQKEFEILPIETMGSLFNRTNYLISDGLIEVLGKIQNNEELERIPQDKESLFIKAPKVGTDFKIRWNNRAVELDRLIRACNPFYNAFCFFRNAYVKIIQAKVVDKSHILSPGQIALANENDLIVATKDKFLSIEILQLGSWGTFSAKEFNYMFSPKTNEFFT